MSSKTLEGYHYGNKGKFECWNGSTQHVFGKQACKCRGLSGCYGGRRLRKPMGKTPCRLRERVWTYLHRLGVTEDFCAPQQQEHLLKHSSARGGT